MMIIYTSLNRRRHYALSGLFLSEKKNYPENEMRLLAENSKKERQGS